MGKSAREIVEGAYEKLVKLNPTIREIREYADLHQKDYGVVTCSKSRGGAGFFLDLHDTWKKKFGGRIHIDVGYVDEEFSDQRDVPDTTHLMLDKYYAVDFVEFITSKRRNLKENAQIVEHGSR